MENFISKLSNQFSCNKFDEFSFSDRTKQLLYVSDETPTSICFGSRTSFELNIDASGKISSEIKELPPHDPSTIFLKLPISQPTNLNAVPDLSYFPNYAELTPEQKWKYLHWLQNISQPIANSNFRCIFASAIENKGSQFLKKHWCGSSVG